jgi:hypothetical protein
MLNVITLLTKRYEILTQAEHLIRQNCRSNNFFKIAVVAVVIVLYLVVIKCLELELRY